MLTELFWRQAAERAAKTFAQALIGLLSGDQLGILDIDWTASLSVATLAALVSVLTSVASAPLGPPDTPSLTAVTRQQP